MRPVAPRSLVALAAMVVALSCGDVPTFADGIAYISGIDLPSIAVVAGDTLRDSLGRPAPIVVHAFSKNGDTVAVTGTNFLVSPIDAGVHIDANGIVTVSDSVRTVHLVGRIGDRLQTPDTSFYVIPKPDQISGAATTDPLVGAPVKGTLSVTVTGARGTTRTPARGIVVRYQIVTVNGSASFDNTRVFLVDDATNQLRGTPSLAIDTTDASGIATRYVVVADTTGISSVGIRATARPLSTETITGNPVTFQLPLKKTP